MAEKAQQTMTTQTQQLKTSHNNSFKFTCAMIREQNQKLAHNKNHYKTYHTIKNKLQINTYVMFCGIQHFFMKIIKQKQKKTKQGSSSHLAGRLGWAAVCFVFCLFSMVFRNLFWISPNITHAMMWGLFVIVGYVL